MRRWAVAAAIVVGVVAGLAIPASAHATLESTNPPAGGSVARSPGEVVLTFDEQVAIPIGAIEVYNANAKRVDSGTTKHLPGNGHSIETGVPTTLPSGGYVVTWRVISADSHPVHGAFTFFIGTPTGGSAIGTEASQLLAKGGGSKTVGVVFGVVRFAAFLAAALGLGGALYAIAIWPALLDDRRGRRLIVGGFVALAITTALAFALQGPYGGGLPLSHAIRTNVLDGVWHTHFGEAYVARLVLLAGAGLWLAHLLRTRRRTVVVALTGGILGIAILSTWGLADHAATGSWVPLALPFDVVHLGAVCIWVGGLAISVAVVLPRADDGAVRDALPRFSQWALAAVVAIAVSGAFAAWRQIGLSWGALTTTPYGRLVVYKTIGFAALIGLASISRSAVHGELALPFTKPRARTPVSVGPGAMVTRPTSAVTRLRSAAGAELAIAVVVLAFSALLVNAQPAKQAYAAPFSAEVNVGPDLINAVVDPAKAGPMVIHLYVLTAEGAQADVPEVDATMTNRAAGIDDLTVPLANAGPGHFLTDGFVLPIRGTWILQVEVRTDAIDEYFATPITVHVH